MIQKPINLHTFYKNFAFIFEEISNFIIVKTCQKKFPWLSHYLSLLFFLVGQHVYV